MSDVLSGALDIGRHDGEGYQPVVESDGEWIVALMNWSPATTLDRLGKIEKHVSTDEVFVLTAGRGALIAGPRGPSPKDLRVIDMEPNVCYNVKREVWHALILNKDGRTIIVERRDPKTVVRKPTGRHKAMIAKDVETVVAGERRLPFPPLSRVVAVGRHTAPGYKAVLDSDTDWIVAVINGGAPAVQLTPDKTLAYHPDTDETFVLTQGRNALLLAPPGDRFDAVRVVPMELNVAYNVKRGTWHGSCMSQDATMIVAEGRDPGSVAAPLTAAQRKAIEGPVRTVLG
jgi:mannose-6-phosphate isomerase-like protein (cupin superfamily)